MKRENYSAEESYNTKAEKYETLLLLKNKLR